MPRVAHYLRKLETQRKLNHCIYLDTETTQTNEGSGRVRHELKLGWACYTRRRPTGEWTKGKWFYFTTADAFWTWLGDIVPNKTRVVLWAHNAGFDFRVLHGVTKAVEHGWEMKGAVIESPPFFVDLRRNRQTVIFCCSLNIFQESLKKLGEHVGITKGDWSDADESIEKLIEYCKLDVTILKEVIEQWQQFVIDEKLGSFALTLASQAFTAYRHGYMKHKILVTDDDDELALSRRSYLGGRTECFYIGKFNEPRWLVDVNSMYPYVMAKHTYPARAFGYSTNLDVGDLTYALGKWLMTADVDIKISEPAIGVRRDGKLVFPIGEFRCSLTTPELKWVLKHGSITNVYAAAYYEADPIFKQWVTRIYKRRTELRGEGNTLYEWYVKKMLNSLYGKFGQNGIRFIHHDDSPDPDLRQWTELDADTKKVVKRRQIGTVIQQLEREAESRYSCPAIAAHVTAYARQYLWGLISIAGYDHCYYCDTDSLLVDEVGLLNLRHLLQKDKLGALSVDLECAQGEIRCPKDYTFGDKSKTKGVRQSAVWTNGNTAEQEMWWSMKRHLNKKDLGGPVTQTITKTMRRVYDKGVVGSDGRVTPHTLNL